MIFLAMVTCDVLGRLATGVVVLFVVRAVLSLCGLLCESRTFGRQQKRVGMEIFVGIGYAS